MVEVTRFLTVTRVPDTYQTAQVTKQAKSQPQVSETSELLFFKVASFSATVVSLFAGHVTSGQLPFSVPNVTCPLTPTSQERLAGGRPDAITQDTNDENKQGRYEFRVRKRKEIKKSK